MTVIKLAIVTRNTVYCAQKEEEEEEVTVEKCRYVFPVVASHI